jgi:hypothetical protein
MGSTANLGLPWPDLGDAALGSSQIKALAEALDASGLIYRPYVELTASAATTGIVTATETKVNLATTSHLDGGASYFTVASSVITIVQAGVYNISGFAEIGTVGAVSYVALFKSNATTKYLGTVYDMGSVATLDVTLAANDTIELRVYQTSGSNQPTVHTAGAGGKVSRLTVRKVG